MSVFTLRKDMILISSFLLWGWGEQGMENSDGEMYFCSFLTLSRHDLITCLPPNYHQFPLPSRQRKFLKSSEKGPSPAQTPYHFSHISTSCHFPLYQTLCHVKPENIMLFHLTLSLSPE